MELEDNFKNKLEERRIVPTASAWDRIEGKLERAAGNKKSKVVLSMAIAASFIAGVFLTATFLNSGDRNPSNKIVTVPNAQEVIKAGIQAPVTSGVVVPETDSAVVIKTENTGRVGVTLSRKRTATNKNDYSNQSTQEQLYNPQTATSYKEIAQSEIKSTAVEVTSVTLDEKEAIAAMEADQLLKNAQRDIISNRVLAKASNRIDANALLLDAEAEVDPDTFKDKVFQTLKKQFNRAVEAVATKGN